MSYKKAIRNIQENLLDNIIVIEPTIYIYNEDKRLWVYSDFSKLLHYLNLENKYDSRKFLQELRKYTQDPLPFLKGECTTQIFALGSEHVLDTKFDGFFRKREKEDYCHKINIPTAFNKNADTTFIVRWLRDIIEEDDIQVLRSTLKGFLYNSQFRNEWKNSVCLYGTGNNGKTTFLHFLVAVFCPDPQYRNKNIIENIYMPYGNCNMYRFGTGFIIESNQRLDENAIYRDVRNAMDRINHIRFKKIVSPDINFFSSLNTPENRTAFLKWLS